MISRSIRLLFCLCIAYGSYAQQVSKKIKQEFKNAAQQNLLENWYPLAIDKEDGGFYSELTYDFKIGTHQEKMVVTQARHIWVNAKAADFYNDKQYLENATHGFQFLKNNMWDAKEGGFYNLVSKTGKPILKANEIKTAYGNAFAIYALAAYYKTSKNKEALALAKAAFMWLENHSHDPVNKGYFQHLDRLGNPIKRSTAIPSTSDVGYKDQNSSIHLLEAFTELYSVWKSPLLKTRLNELFLLIRDKIITEDGYMNLFFEADWTPVSFKTENRNYIAKHYYLDHVSFGHDVETAYLLLEASEALKRNDIQKTWQIGKKMVDHSLKTGWDKKNGGFYDGGYYYTDKKEITIVNEGKNWWAQAEGLNTLLLMANQYPNDQHHYINYFNKLWQYTKNYIQDSKYGGWYEWGQDTRPETKKDPKGHIWKATYHNFRALKNCLNQMK